MIRFAILVALFLFVGGVIAPRSAVASCGDWLAHPAPAAGEDHQGDATFDQSNQSPVPARPCDGPLCKRSPRGPVPSPSNPATEGFHHEVACLTRPAGDDAYLNAQVVFELYFFMPSGCLQTIDRPPKS